MLTRQPNSPASCHSEAPVSLVRIAQLCAVLVLIVGCRGPRCPPPQVASSTAHGVSSPRPAAARLPSPAPQDPSPQASGSPVRLASARQPLPEVVGAPQQEVLLYDPLLNSESLELAALVDGVLTRNQSLQAMYATWRAVTEQYPQAISLEDPMFTSAIGPASFGVPGVDPGYLAGASQKIPWFGKRALRGQRVRAEANAAMLDAGDIRLRLIEAAQAAYFEYYLAVQQLELNAENVESVRAFRQDAQQRYEANLVTQQDVLQAEVELALLERRQVEYSRDRGIAIARINTLLDRAPDFPLPPPPDKLPVVENLPLAEELRWSALASRPDLAAIGARLQAEQSSLALANKDYLPDLEVMGRYDAFWQQAPLRAMVGVNANVPIYRQRLDAAVRESMFRISTLRAEYRQRIDDINREVQTTYERVEAAAELVALYDDRIIPAAQQSVDSARAGYMAGRVDFNTLIQAERQLIVLLQDQENLMAGYHTLRAEMQRAIAGPIPSAVTPTPEPPRDEPPN